jgi:hypothetical protein
MSDAREDLISHLRAQSHEVKFARNTVSGIWRATCSCGWVWIGEQAEVQSRAATHDVEWEAVDA